MREFGNMWFSTNIKLGFDATIHFFEKQGHSHTGVLNFLKLKSNRLQGIAVLTSKQQRNRCPITVNEELPKEPTNNNQGAIIQDAQGQGPWEASKWSHFIQFPG